MVDEPNEERPWFDLDAFRKSGRYIGPDATRPHKGLAIWDIDCMPAPSGHIASDVDWQLIVRGWGLVVLSANGIRLLRRQELSSLVVESFGTPWK